MKKPSSFAAEGPRHETMGVFARLGPPAPQPVGCGVSATPRKAAKCAEGRAAGLEGRPDGRARLGRCVGGGAGTPEHPRRPGVSHRCARMMSRGGWAARHRWCPGQPGSLPILPLRNGTLRRLGAPWRRWQGPEPTSLPAAVVQSGFGSGPARPLVPRRSTVMGWMRSARVMDGARPRDSRPVSMSCRCGSRLRSFGG